MQLLLALLSRLGSMLPVMVQLGKLVCLLTQPLRLLYKLLRLLLVPKHNM
jgi:hypothetical protein